MIGRILILMIVFLSLVGCADRDRDPRLVGIEDMISDSPKDAMDSLKSIDYQQLSEAERMYYDFLAVKSADRGFVRHTSDSVILRVMDYAEKHDKERCAEALYYGGRVYHDLGDFPVALNYYQNALDNLDDNGENDILEGCILSQIAAVLNSLRLYGEAATYIEQSIALDSLRNDTVNLVYDMELLGGIHLHAENYDQTESCFRKAKELALEMSLADSTVQNVHLAAVRYKKR